MLPECEEYDKVRKTKYDREWVSEWVRSWRIKQSAQILHPLNFKSIESKAKVIDIWNYRTRI